MPDQGLRPVIVTTPWRDHGALPPLAHLLVVGDVHGRADALAHLLDHLLGLPLQASSRHLAFLGDLIDRGPSSLGALRLAWEARGEVDAWTVLPGNHELMLLDALDDAEEALGSVETDSPNARLWRENGGTTLLREAGVASGRSPFEALLVLRLALPDWFEPTLWAAPSYLEAGDLLLVHAGIDPRADRDAFLALPPQQAEDDHWAWIREPFLSWRGGWDRHRRQVVVHGHTPATHQTLRRAEDVEAALDRLDTHRRLCLDAGAADLEQVAAVEVVGDSYRLHVASLP